MPDNSDNVHFPTADRILNAAMHIISEAGLEGLTASKLANAVNMSKSTIFHHYATMEAIPAAILEQLYREVINPVHEEDYDSVSSYLIALGASSFSDNEQHIVLTKVFLNLFQASMHDAKLREIVATCSDQFSLILYDKLHDLCGERINDDYLKTLTDLIGMSLDGIGLHYLVSGNQARTKVAWALFVDTLVRQYNLD